MRICAGFVLGSLLIGCGNSDGDGTADAGTLVDQVQREGGVPPLVFKEVDDNLKHDTLLIQVTFDMGDGTFIMVASNVEETFEGVRLYRYRPKPDSSAEVLAASSPGYDSWTMLPTFFADTRPGRSGHLVLANFGERESWGQKLLRTDGTFSDLAFLDIALPERMMEDDTLRLKRRNIAPFARLSISGDTAIFRFACDSVFLYDDQDGHYDVVLPANAVRYTYHEREGAALWLNGRKRLIKQPA